MVSNFNVNFKWQIVFGSNFVQDLLLHGNPSIGLITIAYNRSKSSVKKGETCDSDKHDDCTKNSFGRIGARDVTIAHRCYCCDGPIKSRPVELVLTVSCGILCCNPRTFVIGVAEVCDEYPNT